MTAKLTKYNLPDMQVYDHNMKRWHLKPYTLENLSMTTHLIKTYQ